MATDAHIAWLLNLDGERELQNPAGYQPRRLAAEARDWAGRFADLVAPGDLVLDERSDSTVSPPSAQYTVQVFCSTPSALARVAALGFAPPPAPTLSILRHVNDRGFCAALGQRLPAARFVRNMSELERHLAQPSPTRSYVIKRAFSFAGREQRRVQDGVLDASTRGFCRRSFAGGEGLQVEPWVERIGDFSRHGFVTRSGALLIGPTREQRCDPLGRFVGVSIAAANVTRAEDESLAAELRLTAAALAAAGYFGPFGIDAFRYRMPAGSIAFNPRCEINARFTMGYPRALMLEALSAHDR